MALSNGNGKNKRPTILDVAQKVGISPAAVSKVINMKPGVSSENREKVEAAIKELGYRRNGASSSNVINMAFDDLTDPSQLKLIDGAVRAAQQEEMVVSVDVGGSRLTPSAEFVARTLSEKPAGVILVRSDLTPAQYRQITSRSIPYVSVNPSGSPETQGDSVSCDNWLGGLLATRHLLELGHRRIATVTGPLSILCTQARRDGYLSALREAGVEPDPSFVVEGDFTSTGAREAVRPLLSLPEGKRPTAIFAQNDVEAMGVYQCAHELGLSIPGDLSVIGFDDLQFAQGLAPALTTMHQPLEEMAGRAVSMLLAQNNGEAAGHVEGEWREVFSPRLVERESTAPLMAEKV